MKGLLLVVLLAGTVPVFIGCQSASTTQSTPRDRALNDPMNYRPSWDDTNISGGGIMDYDSKGMKRDINGVLNP